MANLTLKLLGVIAYTAAVLTVSTTIFLGSMLGDCFDNLECRARQRAFAEALPYAIGAGLLLNNLFVLWLFRSRQGRTAK